MAIPMTSGMLQGSSKNFVTQLVYGSIGVGVTLEIGHVAGIRPFVRTIAGSVCPGLHGMSPEPLSHVAGTAGGAE